MSTLDQDVRDWDRRHRSPRTRTEDDALVQRIVAQLPAAAGPAAARPQPWGRWLVATAALVAVGVAIGAAWRHHSHLPPPMTVLPPNAATGLPTAELAELRRVVAEVDRLFPEGVTWISTTNGQLSLEPAVRQRVSLPGQPDQRLLISYTVSRQAAPNAWVPLTRQDIVTYADEPVRLGGGQSASLWCHLTDDRHAAVEVNLALAAGADRLCINDGVLQALGAPAVILTTTAGDTHYQVTQTVQLL